MMISYANTDVSLSTSLENIDSRKVCESTDAGWLRFLQDHRSQLRDNSELTTIDAGTMYKYRYRIKDFLSSNNLTSDLSQAFRVVNDFSSDLEFNTTLSEVYVPSVSYVKELKRKYITISTKIMNL